VAGRLVPRGYPFGAKRLCVDTGYYDTYNRANVTLVDVTATPIEAVTPAGIRTSAGEHELDFVSTGYGSMVGLHFAHGPVRRISDIPPSPERRALLHLRMLEEGYWYARRGFVALSLPLGEDEVDAFAAAVERSLASICFSL